MPIIQAHGVSKTYGTRSVLRDVELTIRTRERVGMVGSNGAGKSTLARILAGIEAPDTGNVSRRRGASVVYLSQTPKFEQEISAEETLLEALTAWRDAVARHEAATRAVTTTSGAELDTWLEAQHRAAEDVERLGGWDQRHRAVALLGHVGIQDSKALVTRMSGGEQRRVALARMLLQNPDLAILDEPTNHLDAETIEWLEQYLIEEHTGAVLLITHDRYLLDRVAERTFEINDGQVFSYDGGYELYLEQKAERDAQAARTEQNRQNFLRRELEWLQRQPKARTTKQKARIERAEAAKQAIAPKREANLELELETVRAGKTILELRELSLDMPGEGPRRPLIRNLDLFLARGEIIGIVGPNGSGKTSLLRAILGELSPQSGRIVVGQNTKIAYFDQNRTGLKEEASIYENVSEDQSTIELGGTALDPRSYLERFNFDRYAQRQPVGSLSGGERARVALAKLLRQPSNLLLMDEPTNDLDVRTLGALESMLLDAGATALVVTHDRWFLDRIASRILAFENDARVVVYPGNYSSFARLRREAREAHEAVQKQQAAALAAETAKKEAERKKVAGPTEAPPAKPKPLNRAERDELAQLPDRIERAEQLVTELTHQLSDPAAHSGGGSRAAEILKQLDATKLEVERLMARWEELETRKS
ncbi:MAG TPA: ABC-F family ATP-binding cassette domain-containing protein [Polyangiaceae bacterium]|nr:ABC-F family ATP-binding cassette domain-containing protein [Polyangiaceae bacterium]